MEEKNERAAAWRLRRYRFDKGGASLAVELYSEKAGPIATDTVEDLRSSPDILPGSLRDVSLGEMRGIEFRTRGGFGETVSREFCSPDTTRSISLFVQKDLGGGLSEEETRNFLESFRLLP